MTTTAPKAAVVRFHLSLNVADLARSVDFYRILFGREPAKLRPDYVKFELDDPPLVLSLEPNARGTGGALNHVGFRMPDAAALVALQERLEYGGIRSKREEGVECCYARQTKFWCTDPDQTLWEIYTLDEDLDHRGVGQDLEAMLRPPDKPSAPVDWEHRLGQTIPQTIPLANGTVDEVRLRGSFNMTVSAGELARLVQEAARVLRPGGRILVHTLVADRSFPNGSPQLSGPAAFVQRVPSENEPQRALEEAGFAGLHLAKFAASPCFQHDGVQMREMLLTAHKIVCQGERKQWVLYKGPYRQVTDDADNVYRRGQRVAVDPSIAELLQRGPDAKQYLFLEGDSDGSSAGHG